jgi:hypothetical protein
MTNPHNLLIAILATLSVLFIHLRDANAAGVELFSGDESPFGISYSDWISKWWTWWVTTSVEEATPKPDGCLVNRADSMVMLMETAVGGKQNQVCNVSSTEGIMVPMWTGWRDESSPGHENDSYDQLSKSAREEINAGHVISHVVVDGKEVAKMDETSSVSSGVFAQKVNYMNNVTEIYSKGFNITIPENTHFPDQKPGTFRAGAQGWYVFLKPLPPGDHNILYTVNVDPNSVNNISAEITYLMHAK